MVSILKLVVHVMSKMSKLQKNYNEFEICDGDYGDDDNNANNDNSEWKPFSLICCSCIFLGNLLMMFLPQKTYNVNAPWP